MIFSMSCIRKVSLLSQRNPRVKIVVAGVTDSTEEAQENSEVVSKGEVWVTNYEYLLSMAIGTLTLDKVQERCAEFTKI